MPIIGIPQPNQKTFLERVIETTRSVFSFIDNKKTALITTLFIATMSFYLSPLMYNLGKFFFEKREFNLIPFNLCDDGSFRILSAITFSVSTTKTTQFLINLSTPTTPPLLVPPQKLMHLTFPNTPALPPLTKSDEVIDPSLGLATPQKCTLPPPKMNAGRIVASPRYHLPLAITAEIPPQRGTNEQVAVQSTNDSTLQNQPLPQNLPEKIAAPLKNPQTNKTPLEPTSINGEPKPTEVSPSLSGRKSNSVHLKNNDGIFKKFIKGVSLALFTLIKTLFEIFSFTISAVTTIFKKAQEPKLERSIESLL